MMSTQSVPAPSWDARVLITGARGQLGSELVQAVRRAGGTPVAMASGAGPGVDVLADLAAPLSIRDAVRSVGPDVVLHAAAFTDVDGCERDPDRAWAINGTGAGAVAEAAAQVGAHTVCISTDFVFSGNGPAPYSEKDLPDPISVYGASKRGGEVATLEASEQFAVARTAWLFGGRGKHFPRTVLNVIAKNGAIDVVDDERGNPTYAAHLAEALVALARVRPSGIFHLVNEGEASRFEFARSIAEVAGLAPGAVRPIDTVEFRSRFPDTARRPADSRLANRRAADLGIVLPEWRDAVAAYVPHLAREAGIGSHHPDIAEGERKTS